MRQLKEGGAIPYDEVLYLLRQAPPIGAPEGIVIPSAVGSQGPELEHVLGHALESLLDGVQPPGSIDAVGGVVKRPPELQGESRQVGGELRVAVDRCHGPIQSPIGQRGDDEGHFSTVRAEPGGLELKHESALAQEAPAPVKLPGVGFRGREVWLPPGVPGFPPGSCRRWRSR